MAEQPGEQREEQDQRHHCEHQGDRGPGRANLQQLCLDLRGHAGASEVSSRKMSSSTPCVVDQLVDRDAGGEGDVTDPFARCSVDEQRVVGAGRHLQRLGTQRLGEPLRVAAADANRAAGPGDQLCQGGREHEPPVIDDEHPVDGLGDLGEDVAGDEHGAALCGQAAQEVPQPADAFGVEPVGRLVEDQQFRVAEQRRRQPEPLAHPERVSLHPSPGGIIELHQAQHLVGA